jgi:predicted HicB family RNase H-like nuclease
LHAPAREVEDSKHPGRYRLTFRMTPDQRRRLRIAAAKEDQSLQQLLSDALDGHLDGLCACSLRDCTCLARHDESEI